jgi:hypothetical protein
VYVTWGKANYLRSLLTGTSFGKKVSKRFTKKETPRGILYQGIGLLDRSEHQSSEYGGYGGLMEGLKGQPSIPSEQPLQADADPLENTPDGGYGGLSQEVPKNTLDHSYRGVPGETLHTLHSHETLPCSPSPVETDEEGWRVGQKVPANPPSTLHTLHQEEREDVARLLALVKRREAGMTNLLWHVPGSGFEQGYLPREEYFRRLEVCLESRDPARRQAAIDEMKARLAH